MLGGHNTNTLAAMTYSSVVLRDSVRLGFMAACCTQWTGCDGL